MTTPRAGRLAATVLSVIVAAAVLAGCTPTPEPTRSATATPTPTASETTATVALVPDGTAEENLPFFRGIVDGVWNSPDAASGRAYIDALVAGGFDKAAMQVTADESTVGNAAESIQFSVRWGEECLIGQVGPATGGVVAVVESGLPGGTCLLGTTRPIDW